ncbi:metallophosphoesterase family protein [Paenibacillus marinisediminis]
MARTFRFVHAADLHLDSPFKGLVPMPDRLREQVIQSGMEAWDALVQLTLDTRADALLLCGDLHDSDARSLRSQWRLQQGAAKLVQEGVSVFIIHGNHDPMSGNLDWEWPAGVTVMGKDKPESHIVFNRAGEPAAVVSGMSYGKQAVYDNLAMKYPAIPEHSVELDDLSASEHGAHNSASSNRSSRLYRIGMLHGTVDGRQDHDPYAPCSKQQLIEKGYDYWALGHIHKREVIHEQPWIVYPGNLQGRHIKETGEKGAYVVDVEEDGSSTIQFHRLDVIRWREETLRLDDIDTRQQLIDKLWEAIDQWREETDVQLQLVRVTLTGRSALHKELISGALQEELIEMWREAEQLQSEQGERAVWPVSVRIDSRSAADLDAWRDADHFIGEAIRLTEHAMTDEAIRKQWMEEALQPLMQQRQLSRWTEQLTPEEFDMLLNEALCLVVDMLEGEPSS